MITKQRSQWHIGLAALLLIMLAGTSIRAPAAEWAQVIRQQPYYDSQGMYDNFSTIRRWVLLSEGYCTEPERHILFGDRGQFISWMDDADSDQETQAKLNALRKTLFEQERVDEWVKGTEETLGYPFALACDQPHVDVANAMDRLSGETEDDRLWGTWDGLTAGSEDEPVSLYSMVKQVWQYRQKGFTTPVTAIDFEHFLAQLLVESGGVKQARSAVDAIGILQLRQQVFDDCGLEEQFYQHRMAQVDCAARLYVLIRRNLQPPFTERFGHLPEAKREQLFGRLLMQTYHSGIGNMEKLLLDETQGRAADYFARKHDQYSAQDISTGMLYHNLGRAPWGWESLTYLIDIDIVAEQLCESGRFQTCSASD